ECNVPIISVDLYPTLLEIAASQPPVNYPLDGVSYAKLLFAGGKGSLDRDAIFWHFPGYLGAGANSWRTTPGGAIRAGDWKLQHSTKFDADKATRLPRSSVHAHRIARGYRDHRHPGGHAVAGAVQGQRQSPADQVRQQPEANCHGGDHVSAGYRARDRVQRDR